MIVISAKELKSLVLSIYMKSTAEVLSAASCTMLLQTDKGVEVENYEAGKAFHNRKLKNTSGTGGVEGTKYLIDSNELAARISRIESAADTLTLFTVSGVLTVNAGYTENNGKANRKAVTSLRQYGGSISDFMENPSVDNQLVATVDASKFLEWLSIKDFGEFSEKSEGTSLGRTLSVSIKDGVLSGLTNYKSAYMAFANRQVSATTLNDYEVCFGVEGTQIKKLSSIVNSADLQNKTVDIYLGEDNSGDGTQWVTFQGESGFSVLRADEPEARYSMNKTLFDRTPRIEDSSVRGLELSDLAASTSAMKPSATDSQELLLIEEDVLKCFQANCVSVHDWSSSDIIAEKSTGDWTSVLINAPAIITGLKYLSSYLKQTGATSHTLSVTQRFMQKKSSKTWLLYLDPEVQPLDNKVSVCIVCKDAEDYLELIDGDD